MEREAAAIVEARRNANVPKQSLDLPGESVSVMVSVPTAHGKQPARLGVPVADTQRAAELCTRMP
jgi:hypothetical protein